MIRLQTALTMASVTSDYSTGNNESDARSTSTAYYKQKNTGPKITMRGQPVRVHTYKQMKPIDFSRESLKRLQMVGPPHYLCFN